MNESNSPTVLVGCSVSLTQIDHISQCQLKSAASKAPPRIAVSVTLENNPALTANITRDEAGHTIVAELGC